MTRRGATLALLGCAAVALSACQRVEQRVYDASSKPELAQHYVTRDAADRYVISADKGSLRVSAPTSNRSTPDGSSTRTVIWPPATKMATDQQTCATWTDASDAWSQQGMALRVRSDGSRFRTIVVAKNTVYGAQWQFNVYTWDSGRSPYFKIHGAVQLRAPFELDDKPRPLPWNVCARAQGRIVSIKGWRADESEPTWDDPGHTGAVTLPSEWVFAGKMGWYAGHVEPGGTIGMSGLRTSTWTWVADPPKEPAAG